MHARFDLVPPFELPFDTLPLDLPPLDPEDGEDVIVDASNMNFLHVPAEVEDWVFFERVKKWGWGGKGSVNGKVMISEAWLYFLGYNRGQLEK